MLCPISGTYLLLMFGLAWANVNSHCESVACIHLHDRPRPTWQPSFGVCSKYLLTWSPPTPLGNPHFESVVCIYWGDHPLFRPTWQPSFWVSSMYLLIWSHTLPPTPLGNPHFESVVCIYWRDHNPPPRPNWKQLLTWSPPIPGWQPSFWVSSMQLLTKGPFCQILSLCDLLPSKTSWNFKGHSIIEDDAFFTLSLYYPALTSLQKYLTKLYLPLIWWRKSIWQTG